MTGDTDAIATADQLSQRTLGTSRRSVRFSNFFPGEESLKLAEIQSSP